MVILVTESGIAIMQKQNELYYEGTSVMPRLITVPHNVE